MGNSGGETPVGWLPPLDNFAALRLVVAAAGGLATAFVGGMLGFGGGRPRLLVVYWAVENPVDAAGTNLGASLAQLVLFTRVIMTMKTHPVLSSLQLPLKKLVLGMLKSMVI